MNTFFVFLTILGSIILPLLLLLWIAFNRGDNRIYRIAIAFQVSSLILTFPRTGAAWYWLGSWWPYVYIVLFIPSIFLFFNGLKSVPWMPPKNLRSQLVTGVMGTLAFFSVLSLIEIPFYRDYENAITLDFPLKDGEYIVIHGGSSSLINHHYDVGAQRFALDISKLNSSGRRAIGLLPTKLEKYEIMGEPLYSPCEGEVLKVENSLKDQIPIESDQENIIGNHVFIYCQGATVVLAHIQKGSVSVKVGDMVTKGTVIGAVGNSGNTSEPHLHIHAIKGKVTDEKVVGFSGGPVPMVFENTVKKFLIRNDKIVN